MQISWIGVDSRAPSSIYVATDSKVKKEEGGDREVMQKVFCSNSSPQIWGYSGDVLFPSQAIGRFVQVYDIGAFGSEVFNEVSAHTLFVDSLKKQFTGYPEPHRRSFAIIHCARIFEGMKTQFAVWKTTWTPKTGWGDDRLEVPTTSDLIQVEGSGNKAFKDWNNKLKRSEVGGTSRAVFQAFTQSIRSETDRFTAGPPQLVSLRRRGNGHVHAISWNGKVWLNGIEVSLPESSKVECFNENFERCDPKSGEFMSGAQRQPLLKRF